MGGWTDGVKGEIELGPRSLTMTDYCTNEAPGCKGCL